LLTAVLAVLLTVGGIAAWQARNMDCRGQNHFAAIAFAGLLFPAFLNYWNLFGLVR
jgi:predicted small integral membrane protein